MSRDVASAVCVGVNQTAIGHPFDTAKVLQQAGRRWYGFAPAHYYRGVAYPLASSVVFNATVFPTYEAARRRWGSVPFAGLVAGACVAPLSTLTEGAKIARQTGLPVTLAVATRGAPTMLLRETVFLPTYFTTYAYLHEACGIPPFVAGGASGLAAWTVCYPVDVARTRQVVSNVGFATALRQGSLWVGFGACAVRAVVVNATNFAVYEHVRARWG
jgi:hypothetical protein